MTLQIYKIASVTLSTTAANISFSNIPQGYTDLKLVISSRTTTGTAAIAYDMYLTVNSATNYSGRRLRGDGANAYSSSQSAVANVNSGYTVGDGATANTFSNTEIYIPNYTSTTSKSVSIDSTTENNATNLQQGFDAVLINTSSAITTVTITPSANNFMAYSTATLYGIL